MDRATVHVIDADPQSRQSATAVMESASLRARVYDCADSFLASPATHLPGCVVIDLTAGGADVLQRLRSNGHDLPVIVTTERADIPSVVRCMKMGATDVLQKPFDAKSMLPAVKPA